MQIVGVFSMSDNNQTMFLDPVPFTWDMLKCLIYFRIFLREKSVLTLSVIRGFDFI
jgi:hypothetical protein